MTGDIEVSPHGFQHRLTGVLDKYFFKQQTCTATRLCSSTDKNAVHANNGVTLHLLSLLQHHS